MSDEAEKGGLLAFEARLAALAAKVRDGFPERARELRAAADVLGVDEVTAREDIRRFAHKIRGTAGSHGFGGLTGLASTVEGIARSGDVARVGREAKALADALDREHAGAGPATARVEVAPAPREEPISEVQPKVPTLAGLRVLAVDDDPSTRKLLTLTLVNVGRAEASVEERGSRLLERLRDERFDVVIVDAMMPELNGLACLQRIAADGLHREGTRYFVLSAATADELAWSLPSTLDVGWLRKPFRPRELVDALASLLAR